MTRPASLAEVCAVTRRAPAAFAVAHDEFLDDFYLAHPDKPRQQQKLAAVPDFVDDSFIDAWIGAVGEHLAQRWRLPVPAWTYRPGHFRLRLPRFVPDCRELAVMQLVTSPPAFRSRLLFTCAEPLRRARFPRDEPRLDVALAWPETHLPAYPRSSPSDAV